MTEGPARFGGRSDVVLAVVLDCADLDRAGTFWCGVLGYVAEPLSPGRYRRLLPADGNGVELLLQWVPEPKTHKNRMHLDLRVPDLEAEVARLLSLGARCITDSVIEEDGWAWHVLADHDGNEFCVLRPPTTPTDH
ncbi:VOC family protein [Micromonospora sediminimaris]|uniref:Glyoxalase n=1 Tax=Micromonospora sediminimaris TaxID=547162 RepID=A0A9W5XL10_9ACTN|nr:VOC family protein [Micromonospora sediminimaris]GIJ35061.1 glyoxalase [Micromonospora sediminimaris]